MYCEHIEYLKQDKYGAYCDNCGERVMVIPVGEQEFEDIKETIDKE